MSKKDELMSKSTRGEGFPCPTWETDSGRCVITPWACAQEGICEYVLIYRAHIALRKAVLGDMTAEEAAKRYKVMAQVCAKEEWWPGKAHFEWLADVVEGL